MRMRAGPAESVRHDAVRADGDPELKLSMLIRPRLCHNIAVPQ